MQTYHQIRYTQQNQYLLETNIIVNRYHYIDDEVILS